MFYYFLIAFFAWLLFLYMGRLYFMYVRYRRSQRMEGKSERKSSGRRRGDSGQYGEYVDYEEL